MILATDKKRLAYLDMLRIIACFLVMFNHTPGYIDLFSYDGGSITPLLIMRLLLGMVVKVHVPTFFMITGTLMLSKQKRTEDVLKTALKFFIILLIFSLAANIASTGRLYIPGFIRTFASADVDGAGPYWYLYAHIGLLLIMPFLVFIAERMDERLVWYLIILRFIIGAVIPMLFVVVNRIMDSNMHLAYEFNPAIVLVDCIFYPLAGFGIDRRIDVRRIAGGKIYAVVFVFFASAFLECALTLIAGVENVFSGFDFLMSICLFIIVKYVFTVREISKRLERIIAAVGSLTFGMYLIDPIIGDIMEPHIIAGIYAIVPSLLFACAIHCLISMAVGGFMTFCWRTVKNGYTEKLKKR